MNVPTPPPPATFGPITLTDVVRYQGASGDMNPSHHDGEFARANGFPGPFVPGLLSAGVLGDWATSWLGPANLRRIVFRFHDQVWLGDTVRCTGHVVATDAAHVDIELQCRRDDDVVTSAIARFVRTESLRS